MAVDPSQFYVPPLGGLNVAQALMPAAQQFRQERVQREQQAMQNEKLSEAARVFREGSGTEKADFMIQNPDLRELFVQQEQFKSEKTKAARLDGAKRILSGENPESVIDDLVSTISQEGGNPADIEAFRGRSPEEIKDAAFMQLAIQNPQAAKLFADRTGGGSAQGFTLSEGQGRYDAQGNLVAYMPKTISTLDNELKVEKDRFDKASKLRGEVEKVSKVYRDVENAFGRIQSAVDGESTGASDMALIFNYMKMLDPGSTVREGEFATAANTGGLSATIINAYNKARDGKMLTEKQRADFIDQAQKQFDTATKNQNKRLDDYERLGNRYGLERGDIVVSETAQKVALPSGVTEEDIQFTMDKYGVSREEVLQRIGGQ
jgi:hypothetical protein